LTGEHHANMLNVVESLKPPKRQEERPSLSNCCCMNMGRLQFATNYHHWRDFVCYGVSSARIQRRITVSGASL